MKTSDPIETERLLIRRPRGGDAAAIFERYASDPEVTRYVAWPRHRTVRDTEAFIAFSDTEWERWPSGPALVFSRTDGTLLGGTGLAFETPSSAMTGYVFAQDAWGRGYATEALRAMIALGRRLGLARLSAFCHPEHRRSARVLEKGGLSLEGRLACFAEFPNLTPGVLSDVLCYAMRLDRDDAVETGGADRKLEPGGGKPSRT